jgi:hypothetical protein
MSEPFVASLGVSTTSGTSLVLDAAGAEGRSSPDLPCPAVTSNVSPAGNADDIWTVKFARTPRVSTAEIVDATANNANGPTVMRLVLNTSTQAYYGAAQGRTATAESKWNLVARGTITDLSALDVALYQKVVPAGGNSAQSCFLSAPDPTAGMQTSGLFTDLAQSQSWKLRPFTGWAPPAAYTGLQIKDANGENGVSVQAMLVAIWNRCVGTAWAEAYAPALIAWMYQYPADWKAKPDAVNGVNPKWAMDLTAKVYNTIYTPYMVQNQPGFGTGTPPDGDPPPLMTGHGRPPKR